MYVRERFGILIVEDDAAIAELLRSVVEDVHGWRATVARDGDEALDVASHRPHHILLLDVNLPGVSGPAVLQRLRRIPALADAPAAFMSAEEPGASVWHAIQQGQARHFLQKPFDLDEVISTLDAMARFAAGEPERKATISTY